MIVQLKVHKWIHRPDHTSFGFGKWYDYDVLLARSEFREGERPYLLEGDVVECVLKFRIENNIRRLWGTDVKIIQTRNQPCNKKGGII